MSFRKSGAARWGLLFVTAIVASNQTLAAGATTLAISAPEATLVTPGVSVPIPYQRPVSQRGIRWWAPPAPSATPAAVTTLAAGSQTLAISAPTAARTAGGVSLAAGSQTLAISAPTAVRLAGTVTLAVGSQTLALTAPTATRTAGAVTLAAGAQPLVLTAPAATLQAGAANTTSWMGPVFRRPIAQRAIQRWGPPPIAVSTLRVTLVTTDQTIAISAPTATRLAGAVTISAGSQTLAISAPTALLLASGPQTLAAGNQTLAISAPTASLSSGGASVPLVFRIPVIQKPTGIGWGPPARSTTPGPATQLLTAGSQTLTISAPTAVRTAGAVGLAAGSQTLAISAPTAVVGRRLTAGTQTLAITAPAATVSLATMRVAGSQTIAITAPTAVRIAGATTRAAGSQVLAISAPGAVRLATFTRAAGTQTLVMTAPAATRVISACLLPAGTGPQTLAISAPPVIILGAASLPANIVVATIENRSPRRTLAVTAASSYAITVLADGPVAYWRLGETNGVQAADATGHGHTGTYGAGVTLGQPGAVGDGAHAIAGHASLTGRVTTPASAHAAVGTDGCSIELWLRPQTLPPGLQVAWAGGDATTVIGVALGGLVSANVGLFGVVDDTATPIAVDTWVHVVVTWGGPGTALQLYLDGALRGVGNAPIVGPLDLGSGAGALGGWPAQDPGPFSWDGSIDDVALYDGALTAEQIAAHYRARWGITSGWRTLTFTGGDRTVRFTG